MLVKEFAEVVGVETDVIVWYGAERKERFKSLSDLIDKYGDYKVLQVYAWKTDTLAIIVELL